MTSNNIRANRKFESVTSTCYHRYHQKITSSSPSPLNQCNRIYLNGSVEKEKFICGKINFPHKILFGAERKKNENVAKGTIIKQTISLFSKANFSEFWVAEKRAEADGGAASYVKRNKIRKSGEKRQAIKFQSNRFRELLSIFS